MPNPKLQPNGWWTQDVPCTAREVHRAGEAVAAFTGHTYDRTTRQFTKVEKASTGPYRNKAGQFAKKPKNKKHHHPPKRRK